ncbi:hypothetical protein U9M49_12985 [Cytobacillus sp. OWB-43]|nr:hypothetical protein [Cytobacillus sp. OWB-43]
MEKLLTRDTLAKTLGYNLPQTNWLEPYPFLKILIKARGQQS